MWCIQFTYLSNTAVVYSPLIYRTTLVDREIQYILNGHKDRSYLKFSWYSMVLCTCCRGCDNCEEWYHGDCIRITERESKYIKQFFCVVQDFHLTLHEWKLKKTPLNKLLVQMACLKGILLFVQFSDFHGRILRCVQGTFLVRDFGFVPMDYCCYYHCCWSDLTLVVHVHILRTLLWRKQKCYYCTYM